MNVDRKVVAVAVTLGLAVAGSIVLRIKRRQARLQQTAAKIMQLHDHFNLVEGEIAEFTHPREEWNTASVVAMMHAVSDRNANRLVLQPGEMAKSAKENGHGMIFIGTPVGTMVVFQRTWGSYWVCASERLVELHIHSTPTELNFDSMVALLGVPGMDNNIGSKLARVLGDNS